MTQVIYDGTYEGWLSAVFEIYEYKLSDVVFAKKEPSAALLFSTTYFVNTDIKKANRVLEGLKQRLSKEGLNRVYHTFLSEVDQVEEIMFRFVKYVFASSKNVEEDLGNSEVWDIRKAARLTAKESHRMEAFVRFKLTKDQLYYAIVEPDCDVLPLIETHFKNRYADQRWLIYDAKRKYGIYYDLEKVTTVAIEFNTQSNSTQYLAELCDEQEEFYQSLWRRYFTSVNIESRKNMRLHLQHLPKRYWKHLTEKIPKLE
ncbi:TIGR03915 family putative DNA repair protein [Flavobacterium hercynium]|uniref:DNA metabolism protein n=1 Tax=Flavobacterium hercynium TaxID=387094 RepID=A0A226HDR1_9FLAO|nr:TIGR03915 family putative DNA repair protein [Flavobacterium hercynium]OXA92469.1 DNA metabolism protein [Flavobacterium hercynium]SMP21999.1 probable DNA metabolism protein [Flavobacterium hercynium]